MNVQANKNAIWRDEYFRFVKNEVIPSLELLPKGKIIGYVEVEAIKEEYDSIWAADASHFKYVLKNAHLFKSPLDGVHGQPRTINYDIDINTLLSIPIEK